MLDGLRPLTVLVAAVAAWAAGLLLLGLAGLGGRVGPHPANAALAPPIPELHLDAGTQRLGAATDYLAVGERPLFNADRRPAPVTLAPTEEQAPFEGVLTSVLLTNGLRIAIFSEKDGQVSKRVRLGDTIPGTGWRVAQLEPRRAVLEGPTGQRVMDLRVFDGKGGSAPTTVNFVRTTAQDPGATAAVPVRGSGEAPVMPGTPMPPGGAPGPQNPPSLVDQANAMNSDAARSVDEQAQIEAIRARIEARRAQLREQAQNNPSPDASR